MLSPTFIQPVLRLTYTVAASLLILSIAACGGGDGGGGTPPPAARAQVIVSGTVQAPNGQVVFHQPGIGDFFENLFTSSAYASLSGLSPVPDGTTVQLGRMSSTGTFSTLASTTVSGGRYSFNLTSLGLAFASDLVVRVVNDPVQMRAFVTGETVNLDPVSESAVQIVLEYILATSGSSLANFTIQELSDLVGAIDALTAAAQSSVGIDINTTISSIKTAAANEPGVTAFLLSSAGPGQTSEGTGDVGNFAPLSPVRSWSFQGTDTTIGQTPVPYSNTATITGMMSIGGVEATILNQTNSLNGGAEEHYYTKDSLGLTFHGTNDSTDTLTPQLIPYRTLRFPLSTGATFEEVNRRGLNFGQDLDFDGINETADLLSIVTVRGFENVIVPARTFLNCAKVETRTTVTVIASRNGARASVEGTQTMWFAPGVGPVKSVFQVLDQTLTEELTSFTQLNAKIINLTTSDLIYDPGSQAIYASSPGNPGSIRTINPTTGSIGSPIQVGIDPVKLARSDNGQFLYVGLDGENAVQRINLATQTAEPQFPLGSDPSSLRQFFVEDMEVLPGSPQSIAISRKYKGVSPRHAGVAIYDNGVQRPTTTPGHTGSNVIELAVSASRLYGYNQETTEFGFRRMTVDASGVMVLDVFDSFMGNLISGNTDIKFDGGFIYTTSGRVIDPEARTVLGTFSLPATFGNLVKPDAAIGRVFFLTRDGFLGTWSIRAFDPSTQQLLGSETIPGVTGDPGSLIRWGAKGLAFRTTAGQVFLIESPKLIP